MSWPLPICYSTCLQVLANKGNQGAAQLAAKQVGEVPVNWYMATALEDVAG